MISKVKGLLEQFASDNFPLKIKQRTFQTLQKDPESLLSGMRVESLSGLFYNEPEDFQDDKYKKLFKLLQGAKERLPNAQASNDVVTSFACEYKDPHNGLSLFATFLSECSNSFHAEPEVFLSPYVSIVQSSMYGKTRLIREIARSYYRTVYVCLRDEHSSGYPPRTQGAFTHLFARPPTNANAEFSRILASRFKRLVLSAINNLPDPRRPDANSNEDRVEFPSTRFGAKLWNDELLKPWTEMDNALFPNGDWSMPQMVVLAIDEARYTLDERSFVNGLSLFRYIRKAATLCAVEIPKHIRFFVIFLDTSSRIQNFSPSLVHDPSRRSTELEDEGIQLELFRPHILSHTFDVHFTRLLPPGTTDLRPLLESNEWLNAGRPMLKELSVTGKRTLKIKLQGGGTAPTEMVDRLAIILARVGAQVSPVSHYASEMVAGNMATLLDVDLRRESCITTFMAEPALARVAGRMWGKGGMLEESLIPALHEGIVSGAFNKGRDGELVAQIIFLLAFDNVCKSLGKEIGEMVPLKHVITELLPEELNVEAVNMVLDRCIAAQLREASVSCVQFVNLCGQLERDEILQLAERHTGGVLSVGQPGLDLFLPVIHSELAAIVVQVKACEALHDSSYPNSAGRLLRPSVAFAGGPLDIEPDLTHLDANTVRIYMQLGAVEPKERYVCKQVKGDTGKETTPLPFPLQIFGVSSRCLSSTVRASLAAILADGATWETFISRQSLLEAKSARRHGPVSRDLRYKRACWPFVIKAEAPVWDLTVPELRGRLSERKLSTIGRKRDLILRLISSIKSDLN